MNNLESYSNQKFEDNRLSWVVGMLLIVIMVIGIALNQVIVTGVLPNGTPITVTSFTEEGAEIRLQKELKKSGYDYYTKIVYQ